jgi:hypothetical protein
VDQDLIEWFSVTSFIGHFKQPFDAEGQSVKSSKNKKSKWYGMTPEEVRNAWKAEAKRATDLGTWYHNQRESDLCELGSLTINDRILPIFKPTYDGEVKLAPSQKLDEGIYPEHMVYLKSAGLCGQSDLVQVYNGQVYITDYKTNKEIKTEGFTNWEGITTKMLPPVSHLDDCNLNHYALQLSMYMYIILKHNPKLKPGIMQIQHITFEEEGRDKYDNPITARYDDGNPIVKDVIPYEVPYLKSEIISLVNYFLDNRAKIISKKKH